jgi:hypothetical protein
MKEDLTPQDYTGNSDGRQGKPFKHWNRMGFTIIHPLEFLHGQRWDSIALAYIHALRPSHVRVVNDGTQMDFQLWRVTVFLNTDSETIRHIDQEVTVGLPDGIENAYELNIRQRG